MNNSLDPTKGSDRDRDNRFYTLLAGGAKLRYNLFLIFILFV